MGIYEKKLAVNAKGEVLLPSSNDEIVVLSIQDMLNLQTIPTSGVCIVQSYNPPIIPSIKPFDDGGGTFVWDITQPKTNADFGTILDPTVSLANQGTGQGLGCFIRRDLTRMNVQMFGAVGDGVNDDYLPLQRAIDYAGARGVKLYLPEGIYDTSNTIKLYKQDGSVNYRVKMFGEGWESKNTAIAQGGSIIRHKDGVAGTLVDADYTTVLVPYNYGKGLTIGNVGLIGGNLTDCVLNVKQHKRGLNLNYLHIEANAAHTNGIQLHDGWFGSLNTVRIFCTKANSTGLAVDVRNVTGAGAANQYIFDNVNIRNFGGGYRFGNIGAGSSRHSTISIRGGQVSSSDVAFSFVDAVRLIRVESVNIELNKRAIYVNCPQGSQIGFDNCHIFNCGDEVSLTSVVRNVASRGLRFSNTFFENCRHTILNNEGGTKTARTIIDNCSFSEQVGIPIKSSFVKTPSTDVQFIFLGQNADGTTLRRGSDDGYYAITNTARRHNATVTAANTIIDMGYHASLINLTATVGATVADITSSVEPLHDGLSVDTLVLGSSVSFVGNKFSLKGNGVFIAGSRVHFVYNAGLWYEV